ncbi:adipokinetic hormone/corazonin-related peptide-like [Periplaneta americana]|uniref:adipokinetic hormone/corazonin-related peptide-like n=1 Tax=Periplaneta americana TaxID=6978 RepID=UPI0037E7440C
MVHRALCWLLFLAVLSCLHPRALAQVTFSRDWNAGKRSPPPDMQCGAALKAVDQICKVLVDEFRQLAVCETKSLLRFQREIDNKQAEIFLEGQEGR